MEKKELSKILLRRSGTSSPCNKQLNTSSMGLDESLPCDTFRTNPARKEAKQLKTKATVRFRHNRPYVLHGSHEHN